MDLPDILAEEEELISPQPPASAKEMPPAPPSSYQQGQEGEINMDLPDILAEEEELIPPKSPASAKEMPPAPPSSYQQGQEGGINMDLPDILAEEEELISPQPPASANEPTTEFSTQRQEESIQTRTLTDALAVAKQPKEESKSFALEFSEDISGEKATAQESISLSSEGSVSDSAEAKKQFRYDKQAAEHLTGSTTILERKDRDSRLADFRETFDEKESTALETSKPHFLERDNLNLDENTQNDLGPAALVNNLAEQELLDKSSLEVNLDKYKKSQGFKDLIQGIVKESSHQIIKEAIVKNHQEFIEQILKEYSQTLEFEQILSEILTEYGEEVIRELFMKDSKGIIERSITAYADSSHFKNLMENTLKVFVQESLLIKTQVKDIFSNLLKKEAPLMAKNLIEAEIKNLLDETADKANS